MLSAPGVDGLSSPLTRPLPDSLRGACTALLNEVLLLDRMLPLPDPVPDRTELFEAIAADAAAVDPASRGRPGVRWPAPVAPGGH